MQCPKCGYEWEPRINNPKCCPDCKTRLRRHKLAGPTRTVSIARPDAVPETRLDYEDL